MTGSHTAVAVVGASGHVDRHLVPRLEEEGVGVRPVGRGDDVATTIRDVAAVAHLAGTLKPAHGNTYREANVETVKRTLAAAGEATVRRLVFLSYVGADAHSPNEYLRTKGEAEELLRSSGLDTVILRSTFIFGPPDDPGPSIVPFLAVGGKPVAVLGSGRQRYRPVFVGDVVRAIIRALDADVAPGTYALAGPGALTVDGLVALLNHSEVRERHLAGPMATAVAAVTPSLTRAMVGVLSADSLPDGPLAWDAFGIEPQSIETFYTAAAARA